MNTRRVGSWFGLLLFACGGRTLDDGVYGVEGTSNTSSCSYGGKAYADGSLISGVCVCFCSQGRIECEQGCSGPSGGAPNGGSQSGIGGDGNSGGVTTGGSASGGTVSGAGTSAAGSGAGGTGGISTAGSSSTGGLAGTGGITMSCANPPRASGVSAMIDDMEDGNPYILPSEGRSGTWFTYNDSSPGGYQFPNPGNFVMQSVPNPATGGRFVANTYGKGFSSWGAGMGFVFNSGCPYDASVQSGLYFFARTEADMGFLDVLVPTAATMPTTERGTCVPSSPTSCYDAHQFVISVGPTWTAYFVPFSALTQQGWGTRATFDPRTLIGVNFQTLYGGGASFSFSIDSISFY